MLFSVGRLYSPSHGHSLPISFRETLCGAFWSAAQPGLGGGGRVRVRAASPRPHLAHLPEGFIHWISEFIHFYAQTYHGVECKTD